MLASPQVLLEDNHLLAMNKPAGLLVHADETGDPTLEDWGKQYIKHQYSKPGNVFLTPCHRLDRPVSGVCLFARTSKALSRMQEAFRKRAIDKTYFAIVTERPDELTGHLVHYIDKQGPQAAVKALPRPSRRHPQAKKAELRYRLVAEMDGLILLEIKPDTGRPHQIRAQLAAIGCPIRGDIKYGSRLKPDHEGIYLHSYGLGFLHPVRKERVEVRAEAPEKHIWQKMADFFSEGTIGADPF